MCYLTRCANKVTQEHLCTHRVVARPSVTGRKVIWLRSPAQISAVVRRYASSQMSMLTQRLQTGATRHARLIACSAARQEGTRPKVKPPPPKPQIIHPPTLPPKGSSTWNNCMLLVDKPLTWTSHDVCAKLKRTLDVKKIGHAGTLDPLATGLLIVCIGKGTKSSELLMASEKVYTGTMKLGEATPSYDAATEPCTTAAWQHVALAELQAIADRRFTGDIMQVTPTTPCPYHATPAAPLHSHACARVQPAPGDCSR